MPENNQYELGRDTLSRSDARWRWRWRCGAATVAAAIVISGLIGLLWNMGH
jgi:hypothetical protein